jgi:D-glycero-alpha-D-manno-heptose-7-phosphate kinase
VLNASIDLYAYATISPSNDGIVRFISNDQMLDVEYPARAHIECDGTLDLHKGVYNRVVRQFNGDKPLSLTMTTYSEAPMGSGLGSSSTLVVAMLNAYVEWMNLALGEYDMAHIAFEIERVELKLNGGKQDQYAAAFGGFNFMEFYAQDRVIVNPLRIKYWVISELEASTVLYFLGVSRESARIIDEQAEAVKSGNEASISAMRDQKRETIAMKESLLKGDLSSFADAMDRSWLLKKQTAKSISNTHIERVYQVAKECGARAGKVSGAGGGGFMMFFIDPSKRFALVKRLGECSGEVVSFSFTKIGTQGWRVP